MSRLILASASPRRSALLSQTGFVFEVDPADVDERELNVESPHAYVERLAAEKAMAVLSRHRDATVLGADTTVVLDGRIMGKPADRADAARMLRSLAGRVHTVLTGIAAASSEKLLSHVEETQVRFTSIEEVDLAAYLATPEPFDKAGAYGIQGYAARWVSGIDGDFYNVVGLPIAATVRLLRAIGLP